MYERNLEYEENKLALLVEEAEANISDEADEDYGKHQYSCTNFVPEIK